jgi:hypothetical protein
MSDACLDQLIALRELLSAAGVPTASRDAEEMGAFGARPLRSWTEVDERFGVARTS